MKRCQICGKNKPFKSFYASNKSKDGYRNKCKKCRPRYDDRIKYESGKIYRSERKSIIDSYKDKCILCGEDDKACLQFHHLKDKNFNIGTYGPSCTKEELLYEISKCVVLCANCHMRYHHGCRFCFLSDRPD